MSPTCAKHGLAYRRFPRVSGDEPKFCKWLLDNNLFSPRERG